MLITLWTSSRRRLTYVADGIVRRPPLQIVCEPRMKKTSHDAAEHRKQ
jgi:hypothetical protein